MKSSAYVLLVEAPSKMKGKLGAGATRRLRDRSRTGFLGRAAGDRMTPGQSGLGPEAGKASGPFTQQDVQGTTQNVMTLAEAAAVFPQGLVNPNNRYLPPPPSHEKHLLNSLIIKQSRWKRKVGNWKVELSFLKSQKNDSVCVTLHLENKVDVLIQPGALLNL